MRILMALAGLAALGACTEAELNAYNDQVQSFETYRAFDRSVDQAYRDLPFDSGPVYEVANEHGDIHTYSLTPCRGGTRICGGAGGVGTVERTADYFIVTGAYTGRTFHL